MGRTDFLQNVFFLDQESVDGLIDGKLKHPNIFLGHGP